MTDGELARKPSAMKYVLQQFAREMDPDTIDHNARIVPNEVVKFMAKEPPNRLYVAVHLACCLCGCEAPSAPRRMANLSVCGELGSRQLCSIDVTPKSVFLPVCSRCSGAPIGDATALQLDATTGEYDIDV